MVGLGNPGPEYAGTRHNVGFRVVDLLRERWAAEPWRELAGSRVSCGAYKGQDVVLAEPQTFMNRSGPAVMDLVGRWSVELSSTLVVHDDLDLPFGALRIRTRGGHGGHNGLRSILESIGSGAFLRLKVGIGHPLSRADVVDHVLSPFGPEETEALPEVLTRAAEAAEAILAEGPLKAMNHFHT